MADADTERTIGLDVERVVLGDDVGGHAEFVVYDAGGHAEYQRMLRPFFSSGALYLLLWDGSEEAPLEALCGWAASVQACAPGASVLPVVTHADCASASEAELQARSERVTEHVRAALERQRARLRRELDGLTPELRARAKCSDESGVRDVLERLARERRDTPPSRPEARAQRLLLLLDTPLRLLAPPVVTSARTLFGMEQLKRRMLEAAHDSEVSALTRIATSVLQSHAPLSTLISELQHALFSTRFLV